MEALWDQPAEASAEPVCLLSVLCVLQTWLHPTSWPWGCRGPAWPWDSALVPAWWGTGQAPGDRVLHGMPALSVATKSRQVPAGSASLRDALWDPSWPCGGSVAGVFVEMVLEKEHSAPSQKCALQRVHLIISSPCYGMSHHLIITSHHPSHPLPFHLE